MKKKLLVIGIVSIFLLTSFTTVSAIEKERKTAVLPVNAQLFQKESETTPLYPSTGGGNTWKKTYGNPEWSTVANWVEQTSDGGYIITGFEYSDDHDGVWLVKIDENGNKQWEKTINISDTRDYGGNVKQTSDGGYIILGGTGLYSDDDRTFLIKTDENGNKEWDKIFEGEYNNTYGSGLLVLDDGFILAGGIEYSEDDSDALLMKTDLYGDVVWEKTFDKSDDDDFISVDFTLDGGYIITGAIGNETLWLLKTDNIGNQLWEKTWKYPDSIFTDGMCVQHTSDGGYIVLGSTYVEVDPTFFPDCDAWLIKTDSNGNKEWDKTFGGKGMDMGFTIRQTNDGGYIFTGAKHHLGIIPSPDMDLWLLKTNANGKKMWERTYGGFYLHIEGGSCVQQTNDGGYIVAGLKAKGPYVVYHDWVIKTNENGRVTKSSVNINSQQSNNLKRQRNSQTTGIGGSILESISEKRITNIIYDIASVVDPQHTGLSGLKKAEPISLSLQNGNTWMKTFGGDDCDWGNHVLQINDGGYIFVGTTFSYSYNGQSDVWLVRTDENGNEIWSKTLGGNRGEGGNSIQQTNDGGYIIGGYTYSYGIGGEHKTDVWLIKTDANGNELWNTTFGTEYSDEAHSVQQTTDGGYIILGDIADHSGMSDDYCILWLIKTDENGNKEWDKIFDTPDEDSDFADSVQQTTDGGYIIIGTFENTMGLIKTDANGNVMWEKYFDGFGGGDSVQQTTDGGYIVAGTIEIELSFNRYNMQAWLIKTDNNGNIEWDKKYGGRPPEIATFVQQTTDGGYIVTGRKHLSIFDSGDIWLFKTDADGNMQWDNTFGKLLFDTDEGNCVQQTSDGGYILIGDNFYETFLIKTDAEGKSKQQNNQQSNPSSSQQSSTPLFFQILQRLMNIR